MNPITTRIAGLVLLVAPAVVGCSTSTSSTTQTTAAKQPSAKERDRAIRELNAADKVLTELNVAERVPMQRLEHTQCAVVMPSLVNGGVIIGGSHGSGVATCRTGTGWSGPIFVTLTGGSAGLQVGLQSSDVLALVSRRSSLEKLFTSGFKLGTDASVAAGPVGAGTADVSADVVTYSRSKGLFAGINLRGASLTKDEDAIAAIYGRGADPRAILDGRIGVPAEARVFINRVNMVFPPAPATAETEN